MFEVGGGNIRQEIAELGARLLLSIVFLLMIFMLVLKRAADKMSVKTEFVSRLNLGMVGGAPAEHANIYSEPSKSTIKLLHDIKARAATTLTEESTTQEGFEALVPSVEGGLDPRVDAMLDKVAGDAPAPSTLA